MNTGAPLPSAAAAQERVLDVQRKLHAWASKDAERRFSDLWNLVCDPATLVVAWSRVSRNRGSRTAGVDAATRRHVEALGVERFLAGLRGELRAGTFRPLPVRERLIPKRDGRKRRLGSRRSRTASSRWPSSSSWSRSSRPASTHQIIRYRAALQRRDGERWSIGTLVVAEYFADAVIDEAQRHGIDHRRCSPTQGRLSPPLG